jgi:hypothetical protein
MPPTTPKVPATPKVDKDFREQIFKFPGAGKDYKPNPTMTPPPPSPAPSPAPTPTEKPEQQKAPLAPPLGYRGNQNQLNKQVTPTLLNLDNLIHLS